MIFPELQVVAYASRADRLEEVKDIFWRNNEKTGEVGSWEALVAMGEMDGWGEREELWVGSWSQVDMTIVKDTWNM